MSRYTIINTIKLRGLAADRAAYKLTDIPTDQEIEYHETDTGYVYIGSADGWHERITKVDSPSPESMSQATADTTAATLAALGATAQTRIYNETTQLYEDYDAGAQDFNPSVRTINGGVMVNAFTPSSYEDDLTMDGTGQSIAIATGATKLQIANLGATTEAIRVAFGTSSAEAIANLAVATGAATTGYYIPAIADAGGGAVREIGVPTLATHVAICNAVASDTQTVAVNQGV